MNAPLRVILADDQELVRAGLALVLERAGVTIVAEAADGEDAVRAAREVPADVVIMDIQMPRMDGIEATRAITAADRAPRVLALTTFDLDEYVFRIMQAGAVGFLLKDVSPEDLVHAVRTVARGRTLLAPSTTARLLERFSAAGSRALPELAPREAELVQLVTQGLSNAEIGAALFLSEATVKTYVSRLLLRLDLRDRVQLAVLAYECGLVRPGHAAGRGAEARRGPSRPAADPPPSTSLPM